MDHLAHVRHLCFFGQNTRAIQEDEISSRGNHACGARSEE